MAECHKATSKKIVKASQLALSDPELKDPTILHTIYALAIKHRLDPSSMDDVEEVETATKAPPTTGKHSTKKASKDQAPASS